MKFPFKKGNISIRFNNQEEADFASEMALKVMPDEPGLVPEEGKEGEINTHDFMIALLEKSSLNLKHVNQSNPEDLKTIKSLKKEIEDLKGDIDDLKGNLLEKNQLLAEAEIEQQNLSGEIGLKAEEITELENQLSGEKQNVSTLQKYKPVENEMRIIVPPLTMSVLDRYARKIRAIDKNDVQPGVILVSLFNRYITKQEIELKGFPQLLSKSEIKSIQTSLKDTE